MAHEPSPLNFHRAFEAVAIENAQDLTGSYFTLDGIFYLTKDTDNFSADSMSK